MTATEPLPVPPEEEDKSVEIVKFQAEEEKKLHKKIKKEKGITAKPRGSKELLMRK